MARTSKRATGLTKNPVGPKPATQVGSQPASLADADIGPFPAQRTCAGARVECPTRCPVNNGPFSRTRVAGQMLGTTLGCAPCSPTVKNVPFSGTLPARRGTGGFGFNSSRARAG
jgi:hypothetical protein